MSAAPLSAAARMRSWYLLHILAAMTLVAITFLFSLLIYSSWTDQPPKLDLPLPVRVFGSLCFIALFWLWIRMLVDYFRERPPRHSVAWGWFLFLGSYIAGLAYFWVVWRPRNKPRAEVT